MMRRAWMWQALSKMQLKVVSVGQRMPEWVNSGFETYRKRLPREAKLELIEIPIGRRSAKDDVASAVAREGSQMLKSVHPSDRLVALDIGGSDWSTEKLAGQFEKWQMGGHDVAFLIGGPDGLSEQVRGRAHQKWSLSSLTLPHPLVRVLLAEQLYRAWTIIQNHPYHRA